MTCTLKPWIGEWAFASTGFVKCAFAYIYVILHLVHMTSLSVKMKMRLSGSGKARCEVCFATHWGWRMVCGLFHQKFWPGGMVISTCTDKHIFFQHSLWFLHSSIQGWTGRLSAVQWVCGLAKVTIGDAPPWFSKGHHVHDRLIIPVQL